jgi:hypothetical protein
MGQNNMTEANQWLTVSEVRTYNHAPIPHFFGKRFQAQRTSSIFEIEGSSHTSALAFRGDPRAVA